MDNGYIRLHLTLDLVFVVFLLSRRLLYPGFFFPRRSPFVILKGAKVEVTLCTSGV